MSGGLVALLDDIAVLAKAAAASIDDVGVAASRAGVKSAGLVIDDAAVTPRYVTGLSPARELPIIRSIAIGSIRNKLLLILPAALVLSQFLPFVLTPLLMLGGTYLCYEGAEKVWERITKHPQTSVAATHQEGKVLDEGTITSGAIRTDFILSAEIMVIALNEVTDEPFITRALVLVVVAFAMTALVYGAVAVIVKMDDIGLHLAATKRGFLKSFGNGLVQFMPRFLAILTVVGVAAMLWVGGHILLVGVDDLGLHAPYEWVHHAEVAVHDATGALGGLLGWLTNTVASAVLGLAVGAVAVAVMHVIPGRTKHSTAHA